MNEAGKKSRVLAVHDDPGTLELIAGILSEDEAVDARFAPDAAQGKNVAFDFAP